MSEQGASFRAMLGQATAEQGTPEERAREAARDLVATTLVRPMLQRLRATNNAWGPFKPTQGESSFRSMLDARLAKDITSSQSWPLVDRIAQDLLRTRPIATTPMPTPESSPLPTARVAGDLQPTGGTR